MESRADSVGAVLAAVNGIYGDELTDQKNPLAGAMVGHLGADLEKGVNAASWALAKLPETRAIAAFLNARSDGVKDLRYGACLDDDWRDADPDEFLRDRCREAPFYRMPPITTCRRR